jgi:hypothetical protein
MQSLLVWVIIGITDIIIIIADAVTVIIIMVMIFAAVIISNTAINDTLIPYAPITDTMTIFMNEYLDSKDEYLWVVISDDNQQSDAVRLVGPQSRSASP